jgi:hypothetical protein
MQRLGGGIRRMANTLRQRENVLSEGKKQQVIALVPPPVPGVWSSSLTVVKIEISMELGESLTAGSKREFERRGGYADLDAASQWSLDSRLWEPFMRNIVGMPLWTLPAVQYALRRKAWRAASDPIETLRFCATLAARRMRLSGDV